MNLLIRTMPRPVATTLLLLGGACASPGVPPGGPEDLDPPALVRVRPDTDAVNVRVGEIGFDFDDVISERPQGATSLADLFLISPSKGRNWLSWRRTRLEIRPREGFRPNTTYRITLLPGLVDLDSNVDSVGHTLVFSTGPTIATGVLRGRVFEWMEERPAKTAWVEAIVLPDSLRYLAVTDSLGAFEIRNMPAGPYVLRALVDQNKNRLLDPRELFDTLTVSLRDSAEFALHAIVRDTLGPGIQQVDIVDSMTLRLRFDRALDTSMVLGSASFSLRVARDSSPVAIASALGGRVVRQMAADSARVKALQDSIRAANDTTKRTDSTVAARRPPVPPAPARLAPGQRPGTPVDTTPPPRPKVRTPENEVVITTAQPLTPNTPFVVRAEEMRSIVGRVRSSERRFATPRPTRRDSTRAPAPRDTGTTRRDTSATRRDTLSSPR